jgi:hypothetical protein
MIVATYSMETASTFHYRNVTSNNLTELTNHVVLLRSKTDRLSRYVLHTEQCAKLTCAVAIRLVVHPSIRLDIPLQLAINFLSCTSMDAKLFRAKLHNNKQHIKQAHSHASNFVF